MVTKLTKYLNEKLRQDKEDLKFDQEKIMNEKDIRSIWINMENLLPDKYCKSIFHDHMIRNANMIKNYDFNLASMVLYRKNGMPVSKAVKLPDGRIMMLCGYMTDVETLEKSNYHFTKTLDSYKVSKGTAKEDAPIKNKSKAKLDKSTKKKSPVARKRVALTKTLKGAKK